MPWLVARENASIHEVSGAIALSVGPPCGPMKSEYAPMPGFVSNVSDETVTLSQSPTGDSQSNLKPHPDAGPPGIPRIDPEGRSVRLAVLALKGPPMAARREITKSALRTFITLLSRLK